MWCKLFLAFMIVFGQCAMAQESEYAEMSCNEAKRTPKEIARGQPTVRLRGVVTCIPKGWKGFFIADPSGGVYCEPLDARAETSFWPVLVGEQIELEGVVTEGAINSYVLVERIKARESGELPKPEYLKLADIDPIREDANLICVRGLMVRTISIAGEMEYGLVADGIKCEVVHSGFRLDSKIPNHTEVEVCGVGIPLGPPTNFKISVSTPDCFRVIRTREMVYQDTPLETIESIVTGEEPGSRIVRFAGEIFRSKGPKAWLFERGYGLEWSGDLGASLLDHQRAEFAGILMNDGDRRWIEYGEPTRYTQNHKMPFTIPFVNAFEKERDFNRIVTREGVLVDRHINDGTTFLTFENTTGRWSVVPSSLPGATDSRNLLFGATYRTTGLVVTTTNDWRDHIQLVQNNGQLLYVAAPPLSPTQKFTLLLYLSAFLTVGLCVLAVSYRQIVKAKEHLEGVRNELRYANETLESKIAARTHELQSLNNALVIAERKANEANLAKSAFLANMSHEIRTPMTAILGFTELLHEDDSLSCQDKQAFLATIKQNGDHLLSVIDEILDLSQIEAGKLAVCRESVDLKQIVQDVVSLLRVRANAKGLAVDFVAAPNLPASIWTDSKRLKQILLNLIGNAIKFTETGSVTVDIKRDPANPTDSIRIDIVDTGIGISSEHIPRLFHAFEQVDNSPSRAHGGTGLGLNISMSLAKMLGGRIDVESTLGSGSQFRLVLPIGNATIESATPAIEKTPVPVEEKNDGQLRGIRVLFAEDGIDNQKLIAFHLKHAGAKVHLVENGLQTIETLCGSVDGSYSNSNEFDLIVTDMQMPVMDGYTSVELLRRKGCHLPIVALTAHAMNDDSEKCLKAGCDLYLSKPIDRTELLDACAQLIQNNISLAKQPSE